MGEAAARAPKVMVISTARWPIPARISLALAKAGFAVAAISPSRSLVRRTSVVQRHYSYRIAARQQSVVRAIVDWSPDLLVCTDDLAVADLQALYHRAIQTKWDKSAGILAKLIEVSLGDPASFDILCKKSMLIPFAQSRNVRCPQTKEIRLDGINEILSSSGYPVVVKADGSWGGKYVRLAGSAAQARKIICEFELPDQWPSIVRLLFAELFPLPLCRSFSRRLRKVCLQEFIPGPLANRAVVCWKGEVLAGISVKVLETIYAFGPGALVEIVDNSDMTAASNILVKELKLSGFVGFDFAFDTDGRPYLLELNPRVVPIAYLGGPHGVNLAAALFSRMVGGEWAAQPRTVIKSRVPLFPQALQRSVCGDAIEWGYDDVPWDDPKLVSAILASALSGGARKRWGARRRNQQALIMNRIGRQQ